jgi:hypothetical protein
MNNAFQMNFFGSYQWKAFLQIKPHLVTKTTLCASAGAVSFYRAIIQYMLKQGKVLLHGCKVRRKPEADSYELIVVGKLWIE